MDLKNESNDNVNQRTNDFSKAVVNILSVLIGGGAEWVSRPPVLPTFDSCTNVVG